MQEIKVGGGGMFIKHGLKNPRVYLLTKGGINFMSNYKIQQFTKV